MDFNKEYAAHQLALSSADAACNDTDRNTHLEQANTIASRIAAMQSSMGAAAACAWYAAHVAAEV